MGRFGAHGVGFRAHGPWGYWKVQGSGSRFRVQVYSVAQLEELANCSNIGMDPMGAINNRQENNSTHTRTHTHTHTQTEKHTKTTQNDIHKHKPRRSTDTNKNTCKEEETDIRTRTHNMGSGSGPMVHGSRGQGSCVGSGFGIIN